MVADGYKDTEVGVIPIEWDVSKLGKIANITKLAGYEFTEYFDYEAGGEIIALRALNVVNGKLNLNSIQRVSKEISNKLPRSKLYINDMLMTYVGTLGQFAIIEENDKFHLAPNVAKITINSQTMNSSKYTLAYLMSSIGQKQIKLLSTTTSQPAINMENIRKIQIPLPPLKEQEKIADILSTADDKIDTIATQIEKAETLKKGLLQKLLSEGIGHSVFKDSELGKIPESWEVVKLSDICKFKQGIQIPIEEQDTKQNDDQIRFLRISDYTQNTDDIRYVSKDYSDYSISNDDVVMVRYGETAGFIGRNFSGVLANNLFTISPDNRMSKEYLYVYMNQDSIYNYLKSLRAAGAMPAVSFKSLNIIKMPLPSIEEQQTIATVSETCDEKLVILHKKLDKYKKLKAGLLQQLLTGNTRVKI